MHQFKRSLHQFVGARERGGWMGDRIAYCLMARQVKETETQSSRDQSVVTVVLRVEQIDRTEA